MYCPALMVREVRLETSEIPNPEHRMLGKTSFKTTGDRYC